MAAFLSPFVVPGSTSTSLVPLRVRALSTGACSSNHRPASPARTALNRPRRSIPFIKSIHASASDGHITDTVHVNEGARPRSGALDNTLKSTDKIDTVASDSSWRDWLDAELSARHPPWHQYIDMKAIPDPDMFYRDWYDRAPTLQLAIGHLLKQHYHSSIPNHDAQSYGSHKCNGMDVRSPLGRPIGAVIVETGTSRQRTASSYRNTWADGASTVLFGKVARLIGGSVHSMDNDPGSLAEGHTLAQQAGTADHVTFELGDSVTSLSKFRTRIDLLYLDSFDFDWTRVDPSQFDPLPAQRHCLAEAKAALPYLHQNSLILIDDCGLPFGGKGRLAIEFLRQQGWVVVMHKYQALLARPHTAVALVAEQYDAAAPSEGSGGTTARPIDGNWNSAGSSPEAKNACDPSAVGVHLLLAKGLPGQGKSSLCKALGKALGWPVLDKDDVRGSLLDSGMEPQEANVAAYNILEMLAGVQLGMGISVIVDSPLSYEETFLRLKAVADKHGALVDVVEVQLKDLGEWEKRLGLRKGQPEWRRTSSLNQVATLLDKYAGCHFWPEWVDAGGELRRIKVDSSRPLEEETQLVIEWLRGSSTC